MDPELNLDVDAPDTVAGVLNTVANAYQASAVSYPPPGRITAPR